VLLGLHYQAAFIDQLLKGVPAKKESTTYQAILDEGRQEEARRILIRQGSKKFGGQPMPEQNTQLQAITDPARLEELLDRVDVVASWAELLAPPSTPTPRRRKRS
jgi:hypothetical protein